MIISFWKIFTKAGKPGWASIIPIYNLIVLLEITRQPMWIIIFYFFPILNLVAAIIVSVELAKKFGYSPGFAAGLIILPIIFYPILAFGDSMYQPDVAVA